MSPKKAWSEEEETLLREKYSSVPNSTLSGMLGKSISSIEGKARRLGLNKLNAGKGRVEPPDGYPNPFENGGN